MGRLSEDGSFLNRMMKATGRWLDILVLTKMVGYLDMISYNWSI